VEQLAPGLLMFGVVLFCGGFAPKLMEFTINLDFY
jgi:hypothetical protein